MKSFYNLTMSYVASLKINIGLEMTPYSVTD